MYRRPTFVIVVLAASLAGCAAQRGPRQVSGDPLPGPPPLEEWSRVAEVVSGAEVSVTTRGSPPVSRRFVLADQMRMIVLNLDPTLPEGARRALLDMAFRRPELFRTIPDNAFVQDRVTVSRDGVFIGNQKIADLGQVVQTIPRSDVVAITGPVVARGSVIGAVLGAWLGFAAGVVPGLGGASTAVAWLAVIASTTAGGYLGSYWSSHETEGVIYHAP